MFGIGVQPTELQEFMMNFATGNEAGVFGGWGRVLLDKGAGGLRSMEMVQVGVQTGVIRRFENITFIRIPGFGAIDGGSGPWLWLYPSGTQPLLSGLVIVPISGLQGVHTYSFGVGVVMWCAPTWYVITLALMWGGIVS